MNWVKQIFLGKNKMDEMESVIVDEILTTKINNFSLLANTVKKYADEKHNGDVKKAMYHLMHKVQQKYSETTSIANNLLVALGVPLKQQTILSETNKSEADIEKQFDTWWTENMHRYWEGSTYRRLAWQTWKHLSIERKAENTTQLKGKTNDNS
jgi:hypothetical protein